MIALAAGYQHFADGAPFAEIALRHPSVKEVYFPWIDEPSGRPRLGYEEEDDPAELSAALRRDLERLRGAGVRLDLLLNANCYGGQAMSQALEGRVREIVGTLDSWGCRPEVCTTASPFVARVLKSAFPEIEVRASVNMRLTTLQAFRYLAPLFDSYYIGRDIQRNLETVKRFSDWCHANGKKLCLLANSGCLRNCPWQTFHDNLIAHSDAAMKVANVKGWSPHLCWTLYKDSANFAEILKSERGAFDGNLLDLFEPGFSPAFYPRFIDNSAFPQDWFERTSACARECAECGYCDRSLGTVCKSMEVNA